MPVTPADDWRAAQCCRMLLVPYGLDTAARNQLWRPLYPRWETFRAKTFNAIPAQ